MKRFLSLMAVALVLSACVTNGQGTGNKTMVGTVVGGGLGGLLGSQVGKGKGNIAAIIIGTMLGGAAGNQAGQSLDRADQLAAQQNANYSLNKVPSGNTTGWQSPDPQRRTSGTFTPTKTYQESSGRYCREYQQTITINGKTEQGYGTACRQPDGSWQIVTSGTNPQTNYQQPRYQQQQYQQPPQPRYQQWQPQGRQVYWN